MTATTDAMDTTEAGRYAEPFQFEAGDELPPEYVKLLTTLFHHHAEVLTPTLIYENFLAELVALGMEQAPDDASKLRLGNFYAEEIRHGFIFSKLYRQIDPELPDKVVQNSGMGGAGAPGMVRQIQDWIDLALFNFLIDGEGCFQGSEWLTSSYAPLARASANVVRDEQGHSNMGYLHLKHAIRDDPKAHGVAQERIYDKWYPVALDSFGRSHSARNAEYRRWGLKRRTNEQLRQDYVSYVNPKLEALGFELPPYEYKRNYL